MRIPPISEFRHKFSSELIVGIFILLCFGLIIVSSEVQKKKNTLRSKADYETPKCIYPQQDADGVHCYEGNINPTCYSGGGSACNCMYVEGMSSGALQPSCPGATATPTVTPAPSWTLTPKPTTAPGSTATPVPGNPTATPASTQCTDAPQPPTNLEPVNTITTTGPYTFKWAAPAGAQRYALRIDDQVNGWVNDCNKQQLPGDVCNDKVMTNSFSYTLQVNHTYAWWVHAVNLPNDVTCTHWSTSAAGVVIVKTEAPTVAPTIAGGSSPTPTLGAGATNRPTVTATPAPGGTIVTAALNIKVRFQGITTKRKAQYNFQKVKVSLQNMADKTETDPILVTVEGDENGVWRGSTTIRYDSSKKYAIVVAGPKQVRKRICVLSPSEVNRGSYRCGDSQGLALTGSDLSLDASNILLMAGDLPTQDGIVNSVDLGKIRTNLSSTDPDALAVGDINLDGVINAQDFALILETIDTKSDVE